MSKTRPATNRNYFPKCTMRSNPRAAKQEKDSKVSMSTDVVNIRKVEITESKIPISTCRLQEATLRKELFLKFRKYRKIDISYIIKKEPISMTP